MKNVKNGKLEMESGELEMENGKTGGCVCVCVYSLCDYEINGMSGMRYAGFGWIWMDGRMDEWIVSGDDDDDDEEEFAYTYVYMCMKLREVHKNKTFLIHG